MKETDISVTILMSVYNGETYLPQAIESILQQTYQQFEFIIINDGSTDTSWRIIQQYAAKDPRIVPVTQENIGLTRSLNKGIQLSKGEFIARQDADDLSLPKRLAEQLPWVRDLGYDLCCSRTWLMELLVAKAITNAEAKSFYPWDLSDA
jgi:glycosyltransferase involved in cell wall biosynthesis